MYPNKVCYCSFGSSIMSSMLNYAHVNNYLSDEKG